MSEVFYAKKSNGSSFIVDVVHTDMMSDVMTVEYNGQEYTMKYNHFSHMYEGFVDGQEGYLV